MQPNPKPQAHTARDQARLRRRRERIEDLKWMAATGENSEGAAERLGMTYESLGRFATKHAPEAWAALIKRKPRDWNMRTGCKNQWTAA